MEQVFAALGTGGGNHGFLRHFLVGITKDPRWASFELVSVNSTIHFFIVSPRRVATFLESQLTAHYPKITLTPVPDYAPHFLSLPSCGPHLTFTNAYYYPLKTHKDVRDLDMLAGILGQLAKLPKGEAVSLQLPDCSGRTGLATTRSPRCCRRYS